MTLWAFITITNNEHLNLQLNFGPRDAHTHTYKDVQKCYVRINKYNDKYIKTQ